MRKQLLDNALNDLYQFKLTDLGLKLSMFKMSLLLPFLGLLFGCTHSQKMLNSTTCRVHDFNDFRDYPSCFDGKNSDGTLRVKSEVLSKINFKVNKKWVTYSDFSRTQPKNSVHPSWFKVIFFQMVKLMMSSSMIMALITLKKA